MEKIDAVDIAEDLGEILVVSERVENSNAQIE